MTRTGPPERLVFFDGYCGLCDRSVSWILRRDKGGRFRFATLTSATAHRWLPSTLHMGTSRTDSLVYLRKGRLLMRSRAVIQVAMDLGWPWRIAAIALLVPPFLRDAGYDLVARNRLRWFGKREACRVPTIRERAYFLD